MYKWHKLKQSKTHVTTFRSNIVVFSILLLLYGKYVLHRKVLYSPSKTNTSSKTENSCIIWNCTVTVLYTKYSTCNWDSQWPTYGASIILLQSFLSPLKVPNCTPDEGTAICLQLHTLTVHTRQFLCTVPIKILHQRNRTTTPQHCSHLSVQKIKQIQTRGCKKASKPHKHNSNRDRGWMKKRWDTQMWEKGAKARPWYHIKQGCKDG